MTASPKPAPRTPTSDRGGKPAPKFKFSTAAGAGSAAIALNMVWQLLVAVVLPIVGGYWLDGKFHATPWFMCAGMLVAAAAIVVVVRTSMRELNEIMERDQQNNETDKTGGDR